MREPEEDPLTSAERELGQALSRLNPAATALDPAHILWEAQRRRAGRQVRWWRGIAAALALALVLSLLLRPQPRAVEKVVYVSPSPGDSRLGTARVDRVAAQEAGPLPATAVLEGGDYLAVRGRVLAFGVRALPPPPASPPRLLDQRPTDAAPARREDGRSLLDWFNPLSHEGRS
jgi:hypothetical protein